MENEGSCDGGVMSDAADEDDGSNVLSRNSSGPSLPAQPLRGSFYCAEPSSSEPLSAVRLSIQPRGDSAQSMSSMRGSKRGSEIEFARVESMSREQGRNRLSICPADDNEKTVMTRHSKMMDKDEATCAMVKAGIKQNSFCHHLEDEQVQRIIDAMWSVIFKEGETVCRQGEMGYYFLIVQSGELEERIDGQEAPFKPLTCGAAFGAVALIHQCPRTRTITTLSESVLWVVDRQTFQMVLTEHSQKRAVEHHKFLQSINIFDGLPRHLKARIGDLALHEQRYRKGAIVVKGGEVNTAIYVVKSGALSKVVGGSIDPDGAINGGQKVASLTSGDSFGTASVRTNKKERRTTVVADEDVVLVCISSTQLKEVLGEDVVGILEESVTLFVLKQLRFFSHLSQSQLLSVMEHMCTDTFGPFEKVDEDLDKLHVLVVLDGEATGMRGDESLTLKQGQHCEDDITQGLVNEKLTNRRKRRLTEAVTKKSRMSVIHDYISEGDDATVHRAKSMVVRRHNRASTQMLGEQKKAKKSGLHDWRAGTKGCRVTTLSHNGFIDAMEELGLMQIGDEHDHELKDRMKMIFMTNQVHMFRNLSSEQINVLVSSLSLKCYRKDATVCVQGERGRTAFIIATGELRVLIDDEEIRTWGPGACLGERGLLLDEPRSATLEVASRTAELWSIGQDAFKQILPLSMQEELMHRAQLQSHLFDPNFTLKSLEHVRLIGKGSFGSVRLVKHITTEKRYALKRIRKTDTDMEDVERERALLMDVDHPFSVVLVKKFENDESIYLLTELITGGQLWAVMENGCLERAEAQFYIGSLGLVLEALHERNIVFRDIKPDNVMLDAQGYVKLVDYGIAKKLEEGESRTYTIVGTLYYMAPEVLQGSGYGLDVDIWSLGVVFYELVCGARPFGNKAANQQEIISSIINEELEFPEDYADSAGKKLIQQMLTKQSAKRLGAGMNGWSEILGHRFFKLDTPPHFFAKILGRNIVPSFIPSSEKYTRESTLEYTFSDEDELAPPSWLAANCDAAKKDTAYTVGHGDVAAEAGTAVNSEASTSAGGELSLEQEANSEVLPSVGLHNISLPSEPPQNGLKRPSPHKASEAGKMASKLRDEVVQARSEDTPES